MTPDALHGQDGKTNHTFEIRCSAERDLRDGRKVKCRRFLGNLNVHSITLICPRCGRRILITAKPIQGFKFLLLPEEKPLISAKKEENFNG